MKISLFFLLLPTYSVADNWSEHTPAGSANLYEQMLWEQAQQSQHQAQPQPQVNTPVYMPPVVTPQFETHGQPWVLPQEWLQPQQPNNELPPTDNAEWVWHNEPNEPIAPEPIPQWHHPQ